MGQLREAITVVFGKMVLTGGTATAEVHLYRSLGEF